MTLPFRRLDAVREPARGLVVLLHGYGSNGADLLALAEAARTFLPEVAWVAPDAPLGLPGGGRAWFALSRLDAEEIAGGSDAALPVLEVLLDEASNEFDAERTILVGFSQGAIVGLHVGLRRGDLAAIVAYSGALPAPARLATERADPPPPVTLIHGEADGVVPAEASRAAAETLRAAGVPVDLHLLPGVGHTVDAAGLAIGVGAIRRALAL